MRALILLLFLAYPADCRLGNDGFTLLHKVDSDHLAQLFTPAPGDREVELNFNVDSSEEADIRREIRQAPEVRIPALGDKVMPLEEAISSKIVRSVQDESASVHGSRFEFMPHFDRSNYELMVPEGQVKKSVELARVSFLGHLNEEAPSVKVLLDRHNWFEAKVVDTTKHDDYVEYIIAILQKENVNILKTLTKDGFYKFMVEAKSGSTTAISRVRVEVLSLSPTTRKLPNVSSEQSSTTAEQNLETADETTVEIPSNSGEFFELSMTSTSTSEGISPSSSDTTESPTPEENATNEESAATAPTIPTKPPKFVSGTGVTMDLDNQPEPELDESFNDFTTTAAEELSEPEPELSLEHMEGSSKFSAELTNKANASEPELNEPPASTGDNQENQAISASTEKSGEAIDEEPTPEPELEMSTEKADSAEDEVKIEFNQGQVAENIDDDTVTIGEASEPELSAESTEAAIETTAEPVDNSVDEAAEEKTKPELDVEVEEEGTDSEPELTFETSHEAESALQLTTVAESEASTSSSSPLVSEAELAATQRAGEDVVDVELTTKSDGIPEASQETPELSVESETSTSSSTVPEPDAEKSTPLGPEPELAATQESEKEVSEPELVTQTSEQNMSEVELSTTDKPEVETSEPELLPTSIEATPEPERLTTEETENDLSESTLSTAKGSHENLSEPELVTGSIEQLQSEPSDESVDDDRKQSIVFEAALTTNDVLLTTEVPITTTGITERGAGLKILPLKSTRLNTNEVETTVTSKDVETLEGSAEIIEGSAEEESTTTQISTTTTEVLARKQTLGSSEQFLSSSEEDDPLNGAVTISSLSQLDELDEIRISTTGDEDGTFVIEKRMNRGDMVRGFAVSPTTSQKSDDLITLTLDRPELFKIRPAEIENGGRAYLFIEHPDFIGEAHVKITASSNGFSTHKTITIRNAKPEADMHDPKVKQQNFWISEAATTGSMVGSIPDGASYKIVGKPGLFSLVGSDIIVSCQPAGPCLDREIQDIHYLLLLPKDGSFNPIQVAINLKDVNDHAPHLKLSDKLMKISDSKLIIPFAVEVSDSDLPTTQKNTVKLSGSAASFLELEQVEEGLYQVVVKSTPGKGRYELDIEVTDGTYSSSKSVKVLVQNSKNHAHFRRTRYERSLDVSEIVPGDETMRLQLEGIPIDEARFVILSGNPGWLTIDDYDGTLSFAQSLSPIFSGHHNIRVGAISRENGKVLTTTTVAISVTGGKEKQKNLFEKEVFEANLDREISEQIAVEINVAEGTHIHVDKNSIVAIDENGQTAAIPKDVISVEKNVIVFDKDSMSNLRVVKLKVSAGDQTATVILHLTSSEEYFDVQRKLASKPVFPTPWSKDNDLIKVSIPEELPLNHILAVVPPVNPSNGQVVASTLEGGNGAFKYDKRTGSISIAKRLNAEELQSRDFVLTLTAGDEGYESVAQIKITVNDIDDNSPEINREGLARKIILPESLAVGTTVARILITDPDEVSRENELKATLSGEGSELYKAAVINGTVVITVASRLDRERLPEHRLIFTVTDQAGHTDEVPLTFALSDINDNEPKFLKSSYDVQAVENWPAGVILEQVRAEDRDIGANGKISYELQTPSKFFDIDPNSGELFVKEDLMGLARQEPYSLTVIAKDEGIPPLNSSVPIRLVVFEPSIREANRRITFVQPGLDFVLKLKEDVPVNEKVYQALAKAADGDSMNVKYSLKKLEEDSDAFKIDETSGDIYVHKPLNFETQKEHLLLITAKHVLSNSNASRILRIQLENVDDNPPKIGESAIRLFTFKKSVPIGRLEAEDTDDDAIFYYLIPSCSPLSHLFTLDPEFGELTFSGDEDVRLPTELCAIASPNRSLDVSSIAFDSSRSDMVRIVVASDEEIHEDIADLIQLSRKEIVTDGLFSDIKFSPPLMSNHVRSLNFSIVDVQFKPSEMVPPLATALPLKTLFDVNEAGEVIPLPILRKQPQGIYDVKVEAKSSHDNSVTYNEKVHLVEKKHKLKFMINDSADRISQRLDSLRKQISDVFSTADRQVQIVPDQPRTSATNSSKSTLCFHAVVDGTILLPKNAMKLISQQAGSNVKVAQIFNSFGIGNIEDCLAPEVAPDAEPLFAQPSTVLLVAIVAFFTFILFCLIVYICFVRKYKSYLLAKEKAMHGSPAAEQFASPTFVLAPPAPMPMLNYYD